MTLIPSLCLWIHQRLVSVPSAVPIGEMTPGVCSLQIQFLPPSIILPSRSHPKAREPIETSLIGRRMGAGEFRRILLPPFSCLWVPVSPRESAVNRRPSCRKSFGRREDIVVTQATLPTGLECLKAPFNLRGNLCQGAHARKLCLQEPAASNPWALKLPYLASPKRPRPRRIASAPARV